MDFFPIWEGLKTFNFFFFGFENFFIPRRNVIYVCIFLVFVDKILQDEAGVWLFYIQYLTFLYPNRIHRRKNVTTFCLRKFSFEKDTKGMFSLYYLRANFNLNET